MRTLERHDTEEESSLSDQEGKQGSFFQSVQGPLVSPARRQLNAAIIMLYALFEEARVRANRARLDAGIPDLIAGESRDGGRLYSERGYHGSLRTLSLFPVLPRIDADRFGGVYVTPSGAAGPIYLVPMPAREPIQWRILRTWQPFTAREADDLFLATFEADAGAGTRLSRLYGSDLSITP